MKLVNHINYPDSNGRIYCRRLNKIITLDKQGKFWDTCSQCKLFSGDYQGLGVECTWEDNTDDVVSYVGIPRKELLRVSKEIDSHKLRKNF